MSINELLAGERFKNEEIVTKSEEIIISTMQEAESSKKKWQNIVFVLLSGVNTLFMYITTLSNLSNNFELINITLYFLVCVCVGLLDVKTKYALPIIISVAIVPLYLIQNNLSNSYDLYTMFLLLALTLVIGLVLICSVTFVKTLLIQIFRKWTKQQKTIKVLTAITLAFAVVLSIIGICHYERSIEKVSVVTHIANDETQSDELIYNDYRYYPYSPENMSSYYLMKTVDLSMCVDFLPELPKGQKYEIEKEYYYIYANDSITKPTIIYIYQDNSYYEWYVIEDFDFKMPTTDTCEIASITLLEDYNEIPIYITDNEIISRVIKAKNNGEDISKIITAEKYGVWNYIFVNYKNSPFSERLGYINENEVFEYEKTSKTGDGSLSCFFCKNNSRPHFCNLLFKSYIFSQDREPSPVLLSPSP